MCGLFLVFAGVAIALIHLRAEQTRCAAKILTIESEWVRLRRELWTVQTRIARLRAPTRLHDRREHLESDLVRRGL